MLSATNLQKVRYQIMGKKAAYEYSIDDQVQTIMYGSVFGDKQIREKMTVELKERLIEAKRENRPLRIYAGYDPSAPDIHIGHTITMRKLRQFQDFGHEVVFLVGTFTAQVGDTSDKTTGRPRKTMEQVQEAAKSYARQCYKVLDPDKTTVLFNNEWLDKLTLKDMVSIASNFTVQQFLARDNYRKRIEAGNPVALHEFFYALLQGYDAVHIKCDVQIGAKEQLFNILAGRKLQEAYGQKPCVCITYPILVGLDGKMRMSKSIGNYIGVCEPPGDQYGKTMSISDETMIEFITYVTRWPKEKTEKYIHELQNNRLHPMAVKKELAWEIVDMFHGNEAADKAQADFESLHQKRKIPQDMPEITLESPENIITFLNEVGAVKSKSEARRLIDGKGVKIDEKPVESYDALVESNSILQVGKRRFWRIN
jgi:tyrosyl-tRNA synthetase